MRYNKSLSKNKSSISNKTIKILDYAFIMRFQLIIPGLTFIFLGLFSVEGMEFFLNFKNFMILFSYVLLMGSMNIINEIFDKETDKKNKTKDFIIHKRIITRNATYFSLILAVLSLIIASNISVLYLLLCISSVVMTFLYTNPFFSMKSMPPLDLLLNSFGNGFICITIGRIIGSGMIDDPTRFLIDSFYNSVPYMLMMGGVYIMTTIPDIGPDRRSGIITTGVLLGKKRAARIGLYFMVFSTLTGYLYRDYLVMILNLVCMIFYIIAFFEPNKKNVRKTFINTAIIYSFAMGIAFWFYMVFLVLAYIFLNHYYKSRFDKKYP
jgi:4-hydroxybenzoate polyprenyltransferase